MTRQPVITTAAATVDRVRTLARIGFSLSTIMTYPVGAYLSSCMPPRWNHQSPR